MSRAPCVTRLAAGYFLIQGLAGGAWWIVLWLGPASRSWFFPATDTSLFLRLFVLADLIVFVCGSFAAGSMAWTGHRHRGALAWLAAGATLYATFVTLSMSLWADAGWLGTTMMVPAAVLSTLAASMVSRDA